MKVLAFSPLSPLPHHRLLLTLKYAPTPGVAPLVLLADTAEGLQRSLDRAWGFSRKWRFDYNFKSAVVVFGGVREGEQWMLGDINMEVARDYKYWEI